MNCKIICKNRWIFILILVNFCILYFYSSKTLGVFDSQVQTNAKFKIANWSILVNGNDITYDDIISININDVIWDNNGHTENTVVAPGSTGKLNLNLDVTGTDVPIIYYLEYIDNTMDSKYILTVNSIQNNAQRFNKLTNNKYYGIITLDDIKNSSNNKITINLEWVNNESNNANDSKIGLGEIKPKYLDLRLHVEQYTNENTNQSGV